MAVLALPALGKGLENEWAPSQRRRPASPASGTGMFRMAPSRSSSPAAQVDSLADGRSFGATDACTLHEALQRKDLITKLHGVLQRKGMITKHQCTLHQRYEGKVRHLGDVQQCATLLDAQRLSSLEGRPARRLPDLIAVAIVPQVDPTLGDVAQASRWALQRLHCDALCTQAMHHRL